MQFRLAMTEDIGQLTALIRSANNTSLLSRLGTRFVSKYLLPDLIQDSAARLFVAEEKDNIAGYVVFVMPNEALTVILVRRKWSILLSMLQNPRRAPRIICDIFLHAFFALYHLEIERKTLHGVSRLVLMGIKPGFQSQGIGKRLLDYCFRSEPGLQKAPVLVDTDTQRAAAFYEVNGFKRIGWEPRFCYKNLILLRGELGSV